MKGDPSIALSHFERVAQSNPNYVTVYPLQESIWTYVGRAQYALGKFPEARETFERALSHFKDDSMARLYLGLTLIRQYEEIAGVRAERAKQEQTNEPQRERGLREIASALRDLHSWLEHIPGSTSYGRFWDPGRDIRSQIQLSLSLLSGRDTDLQKIVSGGESVGQKLEEEINLARRDELQDDARRWSN